MRWYSSSSWLGGQFSLQRMASSLVVSRSLSFGRTLMLSVMVRRVAEWMVLLRMPFSRRACWRVVKASSVRQTQMA